MGLECLSKETEAIVKTLIITIYFSIMLSKEQIENFKKYYHYLWDNFEIEIDGISEDDIKDNEYLEAIDQQEGFTLSFPDEFDMIEYSFEEFMDYMSDIESLKLVGNTTIRTDHCVQKIIDFPSLNTLSLSSGILNFIFRGEGYQIRVVDNPILIGIYCVKKGLCDDNYGITPCSQYTAIELKYQGENRLSSKEEQEVFNRVLYYLSSRNDTSIVYGRLFEWETEELTEDDFNDVSDSSEEDNVINISSLLSYSIIQDQYRKALGIEDPSIKFLYFYKIIEYVSPIVAKIKAYEELNKKLDMLQFKGRNYSNLDSIFALTREYDKSVGDKELAATVLKTCIDVRELVVYLPTKKKDAVGKLFKQLGKNINYSELNEDQTEDLRKYIGNVIYSTRCSIVHAKSNYKPTGYETIEDEFVDINELMKCCCQAIIKWNERQPDIYKC